MSLTSFLGALGRKLAGEHFCEGLPARKHENFRRLAENVRKPEYAHTQVGIIVRMFETGHPFTVLDAFHELMKKGQGSTATGKRVSDACRVLALKGVHVKKERIEVQSGKRVMRYWISAQDVRRLRRAG